MQTVAFRSIGFQAQLILNRLANERQLQKQEHDETEQRPAPQGEVRKPKADSDYVESGLARIRRFDRDAAGIKGRR